MQHHEWANGLLSLQQPRPFLPVEDTGHWLSDPSQLMNWQGELVNCCHAINDQLTQIKAELKLETEQSLRIFGHAELAQSELA